MGLAHSRCSPGVGRPASLRGEPDGGTPKFVPAVVETALPEGAAGGHAAANRRMDRAFGMIEVEIEGVRVRIGRGAEVKTIAAVLRALKGGA